MNTKILNVYVGKANSNVGAYIEEIDGFVITRKTVKILERDMPSAVELIINDAREDGELETWMNGSYKFIYHYDLETLLEKYSDVFNQSNIARISGINESLMRQYLSGVKKPGKKQLQRIQDGLHQFAESLSEVCVA